MTKERLEEIRQLINYKPSCRVHEEYMRCSIIPELLTEVERLQEEHTELVDALMDMVAQHCRSDQPNTLDSCALSTDANAMRLLARLGRIEIVNEYGRRVIGREVAELKSTSFPKTDEELSA